MERADIMSKMQIAWLGFLVVGGGGVLFMLIRLRLSELFELRLGNGKRQHCK